MLIWNLLKVKFRYLFRVEEAKREEYRPKKKFPQPKIALGGAFKEQDNAADEEMIGMLIISNML